MTLKYGKEAWGIIYYNRSMVCHHCLHFDFCLHAPSLHQIAATCKVGMMIARFLPPCLNSSPAIFQVSRHLLPPPAIILSANNQQPTTHSRFTITMNISDGHVDADVQGVDIRRRHLEVSPQCKGVSVDNVQQQHLPENNTDTGWLLNAGSSASIATDDDLDGMNHLSSTSFLRRAQSMSIVLSIILSPVAIVLVSIWASVLGGVSWSEGDAKRVFNWHPVMMVIAYAIMNVGALAFRASGTSAYQISLHSSSSSSLRNVSTSSIPSSISPDPKKRRDAKSSHASMWTLNIVFGTIGILAVFKSHNDPISGYIANMYSLHSWVGITVLSLYTIQYLVGMFAFSGLCSARRRTSNPISMEIHKFAGSYIHILATTTILLGIQEKEGFVLCAYTVESPDVPPEFNVGKIPYSCKISHCLGVVILLMGVCTYFGLAKL